MGGAITWKARFCVLAISSLRKFRMPLSYNITDLVILGSEHISFPMDRSRAWLQVDRGNDNKSLSMACHNAYLPLSTKSEHTNILFHVFTRLKGVLL